MRLIRSLALIAWLISGHSVFASQLDIQVNSGLVSLYAQDVPLDQLIIALGAKTGTSVSGELDGKIAQQRINYQIGPLALPQVLAELKRILPFNYLLLNPSGKTPQLWLLQTQTRPTASNSAPQPVPAATPQQQIPLPIIPPPQQP